MHVLHCRRVSNPCCHQLGKSPPSTRDCSSYRHNTVSRKSTNGLIKRIINKASKSIWIDQANPTECLENILSWLSANGAKGVDSTSSCIALFADPNGERGMIATKDIKKGSILFQIPLKVAVIDNNPSVGQDMPDMHDSKTGFEEGSVPWSIRMACQILRLRFAGDSCPWSPYLDSLPIKVPAPTLPDFGWENIKAVGYEAGRRQLDFAQWLMSSHWESIRCLDVPDGTTFEDFAHAMSLVHSRTFSLPCSTKESKDGVLRFLMPLVDMLNHSGDVSPLMTHTASEFNQSSVIATDAVRWDCVNKIGGEAWMIVSAVRDIVQGEEITLSYGERSNDDFFLYYGFVPPRNPHDNVILFTNASEAVEWYLGNLLNTTTGIPEGIVSDAKEHALREIEKIESSRGNLETDAINRLEFLDSARLKEERGHLVLLSHGRVDERLIAILQTLAEFFSEYIDDDKDGFVKSQIRQRAFDILKTMKTQAEVSLLDDLKMLSLWEEEQEGGNLDRNDIMLHHFQIALDAYKPRIESSAWAEKVMQGSDEESTQGYVVDAGIDANLHTLLGVESLESSSGLTDISPEESRNMLPIIYRAYKCMILWDALLL